MNNPPLFTAQYFNMYIHGGGGTFHYNYILLDSPQRILVKSHLRFELGMAKVVLQDVSMFLARRGAT